MVLADDFLQLIGFVAILRYIIRDVVALASDLVRGNRHDFIHKDRGNSLAVRIETVFVDLLLVQLHVLESDQVKQQLTVLCLNSATQLFSFFQIDLIHVDIAQFGRQCVPDLREFCALSNSPVHFLVELRPDLE